MRWLFGFVLLLLALGTLRMVGCGEEPECLTDADCDDQDECTADECWGGLCYFWGAHEAVHLNGTPCEQDGFIGICLAGLGCTEERECWADEHCDDEDQNECTREYCATMVWLYECRTGTRGVECEPCWPDGDGLGVCKDGVCQEAECLTDADCNDGNVCTDDSCPCGHCWHPAKCNDQNPCTADQCDTGTGECSYPVLPNGIECGCLEYGFVPCFPNIICWGCVDHGYCENGECV